MLFLRRWLQVLRHGLDCRLELGRLEEGQASIGDNTQLLECTLRVGMTFIELVGVLNGTRAHCMLLQHLVLGVEEEARGVVGGLLLFLLWPRLFQVELGLDLFIGLRNNDVVREGIWLLLLDRPGDLLQKHVVHWRDDLGGHVDEPLGKDQANRRDGVLGKKLAERRERRVGGGFGLEVVGQVLDNGFVL